MKDIPISSQPSDVANPLLTFTANMATARKSAINGVVIQIIVKLKGLITIPIVTYFILPNEMGIYNLILVTASMLTPVFSMNLTDGPAIHFVRENSREKIRMMYNTVVNSVLLFFVIYSIIFWLGILGFGKSYSQYILPILLVLFSNIIYKLVTYIFIMFQKTSFLVSNTIIRDGSAALLTILFLMISPVYLSMLYALVISNILAALILLRHTLKDLPYQLSMNRKMLGRFLKTSLPLLPVFFFSWIIQSSASYFLAFYWGKATVGNYTVVYSLTSVMLSITSALNYFWFPISARLWKDNREKYRKAFVVVFAASVTLLLLMVFSFEINARIIMQILVRNEAYHSAYIIVGLTAFALGTQVLVSLLSGPLYSNRNSNAILYSYGLGGMVDIGLSLLLIPALGILGAAIASAVSCVSVTVFMGYLNYRILGFSFLDRRVFWIAAALFSAWGLAVLVRPLVQVYQIPLITLGFLSVVTVSLYLKVLEPHEKSYFRGLLARSSNQVRF